MKDDFIEVAVRATGLNFRDLFVLLKPDGFTLPGASAWVVGIDVAGVVASVGPNVKGHKVADPVLGANWRTGGIASHVYGPETDFLPIPSGMTFTEAATIPAAFLTAYYCLVTICGMKAQDRVLIHVASGGVGLAAIQIAQHIGSEIYATAGSHRKRAYLRSLGITHIYHSRNTNYGDEILRDTDGVGVDIVLNSLTAPNFKETSLRALAPNGKFIEIGKINIWAEEDVRALRPDVFYRIADLSLMLTDDMDPELEAEMRGLYSDMARSLREGQFHGLPHTTFALDQVRDAFLYFQKAKHIGKVVVSIPAVKYTPEGHLKFQYNQFNSQSTYLITGGMGGLGMEVAKWMTSSGAQNIVLVGRSPPHPKTAEVIRRLVADGKNILVFHYDVGSESDCIALLGRIRELGLPPLRGIIHAAGVLSDSILVNQNWKKFLATFRPKVYGAWYLHNLTLGMNLEFFVMFSSVAAMYGTLGQSNHVSANRYLDSLAAYRVSIGLPATTINWGAWSDVGAAAHLKLNMEGMLGFRSITPAQGVSAFETILRQKYTQACFVDVSDWNVCKDYLHLGNFFDEVKSEAAAVDAQSSKYTKLAEEIKAASPEERVGKISEYLEALLSQTLRLPEAEPIDPDQNFTELGVDSLMAMEMKNRMQTIVGEKSLSVSSLQENRTLRKLSQHLADLINSDSRTVIPLAELVVQDSILPPDIQPAPLGPTPRSEFKEVLLTGCTGHLGAHFLPELTQTSLKVHCMIRGTSLIEAKTRLVGILTKYGILNFVRWDNVNLILGDVLDEKLGFGDAYESLASSVDAVVNCAIKVNHLEAYEDDEPNAMRRHNVLGLVNTLRFVAKAKTKVILHASSILAVTKATSAGVLSEEYPEGDDYVSGIRNGYTLSKFIGDKLLAQADDRGIPTITIRYPSIFGNSVSGMIPTDGNHAWLFLLSCLAVGKFPQIDHNGLPIMCVDLAAKISTNLLLSPTAETGVYNFTVNTDATDEDFKAVFAKYNIEVSFVSFGEWRDEVMSKKDANLLGALAYFYRDTTSVPKIFSFHPLSGDVSILDTNRISEKLARNLPEVESMMIPARDLLQKHFDYHFATLMQK